MNIVFFGTPEVCIPFLDTLKAQALTPSLVVTAPDKPAGRGNILTAPAVKKWAQDNAIDFLQPEKINTDFIHALTQKIGDAINNTVFVVVAYGYILPEALIELPAHKTLNVHFSLLPRWRGASPIESALLAGDTETGCAIQIMQAKLDTGPVIALEKISIKESETAPELRLRLAELGAALLARTLPQYIQGTLTPEAQDDTQATYASKMEKADGDVTNADNITRWRKYRAFAQWPQTYFFAQKQNRTIRVKITKAYFNNGNFVIEKVVPEGKKEMNYSDFERWG